MSTGREAFVTLATNDTYCLGARVLAQSLRNHHTNREIVVMVTPQVSSASRSSLEQVFDCIIDVDVMDSQDATHLALLKRPELGVTFTKLHCWTLTQYDKCVFMDADTLVLANIDDLFERDELSAARDAGWPDIFNSGVYVYCPSMSTYNALIALADSEGSFDGGDQGLLNTFFSSWATELRKHLSFLYNMHSTASYTYLPAFTRFGKGTKVVHFIGAIKPWNYTYDAVTDTLQLTGGGGLHDESFIKDWWRILLQTDGYFEDTFNMSDEDRQRMWRASQVDYTGKDRFDNLQAKMDRVLLSDGVPAYVKPLSNHPSSSQSKKTSPKKSPSTQKKSPPPPKRSPSPQKKSPPPPKRSPSPQKKSPPPPKRSPSPQKPPKGKPFVTGQDSDFSSSVHSAADPARFQRWKEGNTDYLGEDSFKTIQAKLDEVLNLKTEMSDDD